ncbi:MAG: penicillin-binding protein 2 [Candidatus Spechtbacterales bacterium]
MSLLHLLKRKKGTEKLWVPTTTKEDLTPEDVFSDTSYEGGEKMEKPVSPVAINMFFMAVFGTLVFLISYTVFLNVSRGEEYKSLANRNSQRIYAMGISRGDIFSSDGVLLAESRPVFNLIVDPTRIAEDEIEIILAGVGENFSSANVDVLRERIFSAKERRLGSEMILRNLSKEEVASIAHLVQEYPAVFLQENSLRHYPEQNAFSHILGYVSAITKEERTMLSEAGYSSSDRTGKSGIEKRFEDTLKGQRGLFARFVSANNNVVEERILRSLERGDSLELTIDHKLQKATRDILASSLREYGISGGAVIATDASGNILSLVSLPDYNPNHFSEGLTTFQAQDYFNNLNNPLFNRVTSGEYAIGSVIKPLLAAAALEEGIITPNRQIHTQGYISVPSIYDPSVVYTFRDNANHGTVDMSRALAVSSNVYFYILGGGYQDYDGLGIDKLAEWLNKFNWGRVLGINFSSESSGLVPTPEWKQETRGESWSIGDTYNASIGQGDVLVTPLQVNAAMAVFANRGTLYTPNIIKSIYTQDGAIQEFKNGDIINDDFVSVSNLSAVNNGLREAVRNGSSRFLLQLPVSSAGKTGTAQTGGENNAWWSGFAPYEDPEIVLTVILEEGEASDRAVRVAYRIFNEYFSQLNEEEVENIVEE